MPEWLLKEENYIPIMDKDTFIKKSILSLLKVLSRLRAQEGGRPDRFYADASLKVFFTFFLVILVTLCRSLPFIMIADAYLLLVLSLLPAKDILRILKVGLVVLIFTSVILLPSLIWGNYYSLIMITAKVFTTVTAVNILSYSTRWDSIVRALKRFWLPDIFIFVLDITIKYIYLLGQFSLEMLYALKSRSVGRNKNKYASLSGIAGTMFVKSREMAEDMHAAMICRGFTGEYQVEYKFKLGWQELIYIIINCGLIVAFIFWGRG